MAVWSAVIAIIVGFAVAGVGLCIPEMWVIITGAVIVAVGGLAALRVGIMEQTH